MRELGQVVAVLERGRLREKGEGFGGLGEGG